MEDSPPGSKGGGGIGRSEGGGGRERKRKACKGKEWRQEKRKITCKKRREDMCLEIGCFFKAEGKSLTLRVFIIDCIQRLDNRSVQYITVNMYSVKLSMNRTVCQGFGYLRALHIIAHLRQT